MDLSLDYYSTGSIEVLLGDDSLGKLELVLGDDSLLGVSKPLGERGGLGIDFSLGLVTKTELHLCDLIHLNLPLAKRIINHDIY